LRRQAMDRINKMKDPSFSNESPSFLMEGFLFSCFFAMLIFPNMVFSGNHWFQSLHLLKWVTAFVPIALIVLVLWASSFNKRVVFFFSVDFFALIWLAFLVYITLQPLWVPISSPPNILAKLVLLRRALGSLCCCFEFFLYGVSLFYVVGKYH
jgi:O-antigen polymerase